LYTAGLDGAVSSFGVQVSDRQLELLFDYAEVVIFALDNDEAGIKKSLELRQKFLKSGRRIRFANYDHIPDAKDLGTDGVSDNEIQRAILEAKSILRYR
jgi:DNA primase